jgi:hypothetical protein
VQHAVHRGVTQTSLLSNVCDSVLPTTCPQPCLR